MILDFVTNGRNIIKIASKLAGVAGLIVSTVAGLHGGAVPAFQVTTPGGANIFQISSSGAIGVGSAASFGNSGDCLKSGGGSGSLMTFGTCGSGGGGSSFSSGQVLGIGDARYVKKSGDTMTGALFVKGANVTVSGSYIAVTNKANNTLVTLQNTNNAGELYNAWSNGDLLWDLYADTTYPHLLAGDKNNNTVLEFKNTTDGNRFSVKNGSFSGGLIHADNTLASSGGLVWEGAASGASLYVATSINGAGLTDCSNTTTSKLLWNSSTGRFSCASDQDTTYKAGQGLTLTSGSFKVNGTITGSLVSFQTISGSTVYAKNTLTSSGSLKVLGNMSGATLNVNSLKNCTNTQTDANGRLACNSSVYLTSDQTKAGQGLALSSNVLTLNATITGSLVRFLTVSGSALFAKNTLTSSGTLKVLGNMSGASLNINNLKSCANTKTDANGAFSCNSTTYLTADQTIAGQGLSLGGSSIKLNTTITGSLVSFQTLSGSAVYAKNTLTSSGTLKVLSTISGSSLNIDTTSTFKGNVTIGRATSATPRTLYLSDIGNVTGGVPQLIGNWNASNNWGIGGTPAGVIILGNVTASAWGTQITTIYSNAFSGAYIHAGRSLTSSGDLMVTGTATGSRFLAQKTLASSGGLIWEGAASGSSLYVGTSLQGLGLTDCLGSNKLLWASATGRFSCGVDSTAGSAGRGLALSAGVLTLNTTITGSLVSFQTLSGSAIYAKNTLTSSGTLKVLGNMSGATLNVNSLKSCTNTQTDANGRFACNSSVYLTADQTKGGQGLTLTTNTLSLNATITGSLVRFLTHSGAAVFAKTTLSSSGTLKVLGNMSGASLNINNLLNCAFIKSGAAGVLSCGTTLGVAAGGTNLTALPTKTFTLSAGGATPSGITGTAQTTASGSVGKNKSFTTNGINLQTQDFSGSGHLHYAQWTAIMPDSYDGGTVTAAFSWMTNTTGGGTLNGVKWYLQCQTYGSGTTIDTAWGTAVGVADTVGMSTANKVHISGTTTAITCAGTPAGGKLLQFRAYRDPTDAADTLAGTASLLGVKGEYTVSSYSDN